MIGLVILGLILVPLFVLMIISVLEPPRELRVAAMFTGTFALLVGGMLVGFVLLALALRFVVPQ